MKNAQILIALIVFSTLGLQTSQAKLAEPAFVEYVDGRPVTTASNTGAALQAGAGIPGPGPGADSTIPELCEPCLRQLAAVPDLQQPRFLLQQSGGPGAPAAAPAGTHTAQ